MNPEPWTKQNVWNTPLLSETRGMQPTTTTEHILCPWQNSDKDVTPRWEQRIRELRYGAQPVWGAAALGANFRESFPHEKGIREVSKNTNYLLLQWTPRPWFGHKKNQGLDWWFVTIRPSSFHSLPSPLWHYGHSQWIFPSPVEVAPSWSTQRILAQLSHPKWCCHSLSPVKCSDPSFALRMPRAPPACGRMTKSIPPGARERRRWGKLLAICQASPLCFFIFSFCSLLESFYLCSGFHGNCISCLSSLALNFLFDFPSSQDMTLFSFCKNELSVVFSLVADIFKGGKRDFHSAAESV